MWGEEWLEVPPEEPLGPTMVFVYGSLKKGFKHHNLLGSNPIPCGDVETESNYLLYDTGPYPGMIEVKEGQGRSIEGELYLLSVQAMKNLDKSIPGFTFKKKEVKIKNYPADAAIITHIYEQGVGRFLDCGTSWPRY